MARGDKSTYNQQQQQAFGQSQQAAQRGYQNQQNLYSTLTPMYQAEYDNPGYSDAEKQAMTQAATGSLAGAFGAARDRLQNQAARTGNSAGENATEEELGMQQGRANSQALGSLEGQFGNARIQGQQNAMGGLSNLYGSTTQGLDSAMNTGANLVGTQARVATTPGFWSQVLQHGLNAMSGGAAGAANNR
ncbi:MAG TPA: hypothetical protein VN515_02975 [Terriglobales bacterium]|nr:hypothetical protein [Terriglobales bacterium]